jgi:hypothetical protein
MRRVFVFHVVSGRNHVHDLKGQIGKGHAKRQGRWQHDPRVAAPIKRLTTNKINKAKTNTPWWIYFGSCDGSSVYFESVAASHLYFPATLEHVEANGRMQPRDPTVELHSTKIHLQTQNTLTNNKQCNNNQVLVHRGWRLPWDA